MPACINSDQHINEGDALIQVPDNWQGMSDAGAMRVECGMCGGLVELNLCIHTKGIGFHYKSHEVPA